MINKVEKTFGTSDLIDAPMPKRTEYPLLGLEDDFLQIQLENGEMCSDITFSTQESMKDVKELIKKYVADEVDCLVTILSVCGQQIPVAAREDI